MIIQCEKCQTRFRLDDSRVTAKGVKVRCTKCKHVFTVQREDAGAEQFEPEGGSFGFSFPDEQEKTPAAAPEERQAAAESVPDAPADSGLFGDVSPPRQEDAAPFDTLSFDASAISFDSDEFQVDGSEDVAAAADEPAADGGEVDFSNFDFGDSDSEPDSAAHPPLSVDDFTAPVAEPRPAPRNVAQQGLDFSDDDMFGAVVPSAPEATSGTITFDFEGDSFADSMDMSGQDHGGKGGTPFSLDSPGDAPFSLGEIDFGDELTSVAVQQVNPEDLKPSHEILFAPLAEARVKSTDDDLRRSFFDESEDGDQAELPPLSIASRRKQSPLFGVLISVAALLAISALGYFGYSSFSASKETAAAPESGKISVQGVKASFIENDQAGELLVISGEALNGFPESRAALQVTVTVLDAAGQSVATKTAYGGNPLTEEQLGSLPLDKIEAAMINQFGDSLANMEVPPGATIPFLVVLANLPKDAKDFVVQPAGSTVAAGKQQ